MSQSAFQAFFFDFDGVLVDSVEVKTKAFATLFEPYGPTITGKVIDHHRHHGGMNRKDKFIHYFKEFLGLSLSEKEIINLCTRFSELVVDEVVKASATPGVEDFLVNYYNQCPCFIVSATPHDELKNIVKQRCWNHYFRDVCGVPPAKQENLLILINRYFLAPERCIFFGDAESDYMASQSCGIPFVGIALNPDAPILKALPMIQWVSDFVDIEKKITFPPSTDE